jgi:insertion element IS1 protein InsB
VVTGLRQPEIRSGPKASPEQAKKRGRLSLQCDEVWSFVGSKARKKWIWLALDASTREIVGVFVGSRGIMGAKGLWRSLPAIYRQCAVLYTDFWKAYAEVFPTKRHKAVGKSSGKTNGVERFNCTLRQRVSRLVRRTLSFSKKLENHLGAIWFFVHHYNASLPL